AGGHDSSALPLALSVWLCPSGLRADPVASGLGDQCRTLLPLARGLCPAGGSRSWQRARVGGGPGGLAHEPTARRSSASASGALAPLHAGAAARRAVVDVLEHPIGQPAPGGPGGAGHPPVGPLRSAAERSRPCGDHPVSHPLSLVAC